MQIYLISALIFSLLVATFAVQNTEVVSINFLTWSFSVSLVLVLLGAAVAGALVLYFFGLFKQVGAWMKIRQLNHRKDELEKQVKKLEEKLNTCAGQTEPKNTAGAESAGNEGIKPETVSETESGGSKTV
ncbi:MAG: LapA family protein [Clostridia bacterium]|jgi:uncharacterized integral membrane protein|nr:LapA family protein [Clostridia bacterium]